MSLVLFEKGGFMSFELFVVSIVGVAFLLVPGSLFLKALRVPIGRCISAAPLFTLTLLSVLSILFDAFGIKANPITLVLIPLICLLVLVVLSNQRVSSENEDVRDIPLPYVALYALSGLAAGIYIFVSRLERPIDFIPSYDQIHHLNGVRVFAETEVFSFLHNSLYTAQEVSEIAPIAATGFYPSGWHALCALLVQALDINPAMSMNAVNFVFSSLALPLSMLSLIWALFPDNRRILLFGAVASVSFTAFPWMYLVWGPLFPNLASYAVVPAACSLFIMAFYGGVAVRMRCRAFILFAIGFVGVALAHPNGVFVIAVMLGAYLVHAALKGTIRELFGITTGKLWLDATLLVLTFTVLWFLVFNMPFLNSVVTFVWKPYQSPLRAVLNFVLCGATRGFFGPDSFQLAIAALLAAATIASFGEHRIRWAVQAYVFWGVSFVLASSTENIFTHLLAGFWYCDPTRIVAASVPCGIVLASFGFDRLCGTAETLLAARKAEPLAHRIIAPAVALVFIAMTFAPTMNLFGRRFETGLARMRVITSDLYWSQFGRFVLKERLFMDRVSEIVPDGAVVANNPCDGSVFAYGACDVHVLYRQITGLDGENERAESVLIRLSLNEYSFNPAVKDAVESVGVEYVVQLVPPTDSEDEWSIFADDGSEMWPGIMAVDESTPGFTLVLEDGDMRLYKVDNAI